MSRLSSILTSHLLQIYKMSYHFDIDFVIRNMPLLLEGLFLTAKVSGISVLIAMTIGMLLALCRTAQRRPIRLVSVSYIEFLRNTPTLNHLYLVFFGLPLLGISFSPMFAAVIALSAQHSAFFAEIYRGGIQSISIKQYEAGLALGMSRWLIWRLVILPQSLIRVIPPMVNELILLFKDSSLLASIGIIELTLTGRLLAEQSAASFEVFVGVGGLYLVVSSILTAFMKLLERRLAYVF